MKHGSEDKALVLDFVSSERKFIGQRCFSGDQLAQLRRCSFEHARYDIIVLDHGMTLNFPAHTLTQRIMHPNVTAPGYDGP